jgi:hypothetical protein
MSHHTTDILAQIVTGAKIWSARSQSATTAGPRLDQHGAPAGQLSATEANMQPGSLGIPGTSSTCGRLAPIGTLLAIAVGHILISAFFGLCIAQITLFIDPGTQ